jgi:DDE superfamily endonuclease
LDVEIGWPGSVADSRIFLNSWLGSNYIEPLAGLGTTTLLTGDDMEEEIPAFILGDSAYQNSRHLVTTYKTTETNADPHVRRLNARLSKARYFVEHAFGLLKGRFQIFSKPLRSAGEDLPFAVYLIASICVLHNFLIDMCDSVRDADILPPEVTERLQQLNLDTNGLSGEPGDGQGNDPEDSDEEVENLNEDDATRDVLLRHIRFLG